MLKIVLPVILLQQSFAISATKEHCQHRTNEQPIRPGRVRPAQLRLRPGQELPEPELRQPLRLPGRHVRRINDVQRWIFSGTVKDNNIIAVLQNTFLLIESSQKNVLETLK